MLTRIPSGKSGENPPFDVVRIAAVFVIISAALAFCYFTRSIIVPTVMAVFLSYVLSPFVEGLSRIRLPGTHWLFPRSIAVFVVVTLSLTLVTLLGVFVAEETVDFVGEIPQYQTEIADNITSVRTQILEWQNHVTAYLEPIRGDEAPVERVETDRSRELALWDTNGLEVISGVSNYVFGSITSLFNFMGQVMMCLFVLFFLLLEGPILRTKAINILGTSLRRRRIALEIMRNVNEDVQRYLFNRVATNAVLAVLVGLAYFAFGLKYAFLLGTLAGIFNFVPYVGPMVGGIFPALAAYMQFGDLASVFWVLAVYTFLTGTEGNIVTPIVLGKHLKLNSLAVLLACIFWGWLWGPIGLFLAVPIMAVFKAMAEHVDPLRPLGELLRG